MDIERMRQGKARGFGSISFPVIFQHGADPHGGSTLDLLRARARVPARATIVAQWVRGICMSLWRGVTVGAASVYGCYHGSYVLSVSCPLRL